MPALTVAAWVVFWNAASVPAFVRNGEGLDQALVEWTGVDEKGMPFRRPRTAAQEDALRAGAKRHGTKLFGMANNFVYPSGFDAARMSRMLKTPASRRAHARALVRIAKEDRLAGFDLDYESLSAGDRDAFSLFVRVLADELHAAGKRLSVTVHPKLEDVGGWEGPKAQDYRAIGRAADVVRIMAYDFSYASAPAGPIAPDEWVRRVATYSVSRIPARKVSLGIPCYGYDWATTPATSVVWDDVAARFPAAGGADGLAPDSGERLLGSLRFAGSASFARKLAIAREFGLGGVSFWYVGSEEPGVWPLLRR